MVQKKGDSYASRASPPTGTTNSERKRNSNFSRDEVRCLVVEYKKRSNIFSFGTREQMQRSWEEITGEINKIHPEFMRSANEVKKKWIGLLHDSKKQYYKAISDAQKRGDNNRRRLSDVAEMIVKLKGGFSNSSIASKSGVNFTQIDNEYPSNFQVPTISECDSTDEENDIFCIDSKTGLAQSTDSSFNNMIMPFGHSGKETVESAKVSDCTCKLSELITLKKEILTIKKRKLEISEDHRWDEKMFWWEKRMVMQQVRKKLELEIKLLEEDLNAKTNKAKGKRIK